MVMQVADLRAPGTEPSSATVDIGSPAKHLVHLTERILANLQQTFADLVAAPMTLPEVVRSTSPDGSTGWLWRTVLITAVAMLIGWGIERAIARKAAGTLATPDLAAAPRARRIRATMAKTAAEAVIVAIGLFCALLLTVALARTGHGQMTVILSAFEVVILTRFLLLFVRAVLPAEEVAIRLIPISADAARDAYTRLRRRLWISAMLAGVMMWLVRIGAAEGIITAARILVALAVAITFARAALDLRGQRQVEQPQPGTRRGWLARNWHRVVITYLVFAVAATALARLAGIQTGGLVVAPAFAAILAVVIYAVLLLVVDAAFGEDGATESNRLPSFRHWGERSAALIAGIAAVCAVLGAWGVNFTRSDGTVRPIYAIMLVVVLAYVGWQAIRTAFDRRIAMERAASGPSPEDGDEGGAGGTRLATLLPLFRNAVLIAILIVAVMVMLSSMGLDIGPLFAGAGLVGVAIGFGSQALVRDIFSGMFFLIDDAFRVGEYIDTGDAKGTVERISIRSMQLRHQNGPLHTVPFGEIKQLTNFSRDWVIMKLPIRVRFGTDTERVRKLVKKLGQELLEHPQVGHLFVEPLKSQGVYQMDEYGIVTRIKFKTRPGDQFAVRKVVYQKINELFENEGIAFGGREVVVRAAEDGDDKSSTAAAAAAAMAAQTGPGGG